MEYLEAQECPLQANTMCSEPMRTIVACAQEAAQDTPRIAMYILKDLHSLHMGCWTRVRGN